MRTALKITYLIFILYKHRCRLSNKADKIPANNVATTQSVGDIFITEHISFLSPFTLKIKKYMIFVAQLLNNDHITYNVSHFQQPLIHYYLLDHTQTNFQQTIICWITLVPTNTIYSYFYINNIFSSSQLQRFFHAHEQRSKTIVMDIEYT